MALTLRYAARSDVGLIRKGNEDSAYAGPHVLAVADGMGGHAAGELASAIAVASLASIDLIVDDPLTAAEVLPTLANAIDFAGTEIGDLIAGSPQYTGMGTTATAIYWQADRIAIVHVGDSRAYLMRDGSLTQITHDHTYVQTLVDAGQITAEEALTHPRRNLIMRAIDGINPIEADLSIREVHAGDRFLLCSDGLSGVVSDAQIASCLSQPDLTSVVGMLVDAALAAGAPDNVTVVVGDVLDTDEATRDAMAAMTPVVVGAVSEPRVRSQLPEVSFPDDRQVEPAEAIGSPLVQHSTEPIDLTDEPPAKTRRGRSPLVIALAIALPLLLIVLVLVGSLTWLKNKWYVGTNNQTVVIYQGISGSLLGIPLQEVAQTTDVPVAFLPPLYQELVDKGIPAETYDEAVAITDQLAAQAAACQLPNPPAGCVVLQ